MAISLKRVKIEEKLLWRAYRKSPTLFRMVPKLKLLLPQERLNLRISNLLCTFIESIRIKEHQDNLGKVSIGVVRSLKNFHDTHT